MKHLLIIAQVFILTNAYSQNNFKLLSQRQFFALSVKNLDETTEWYQRNLGFEKINRMIAKDSSSINEILKSGNIIIEIQQQKNAVSKDEFRKQADFLWHGIFKVGIYVSSIDEVIAQLKLNNTALMMGPITDTDNKIRFFMVRDNNRNVIQFIETLK